MMVLHKALLLIKGLTLEEMKHGTGPIFLKFTVLTMFPHYREAADVTEWWNGLLKLSYSTS